MTCVVFFFIYHSINNTFPPLLPGLNISRTLFKRVDQWHVKTPSLHIWLDSTLNVSCWGETFSAVFGVRYRRRRQRESKRERKMDVSGPLSSKVSIHLHGRERDRYAAESLYILTKWNKLWDEADGEWECLARVYSVVKGPCSTWQEFKFETFNLGKNI